VYRYEGTQNGDTYKLHIILKENGLAKQFPVEKMLFELEKRSTAMINYGFGGYKEKPGDFRDFQFMRLISREVRMHQLKRRWNCMDEWGHCWKLGRVSTRR